MALFMFAAIPVNAVYGPRNCPGLIIRFYANVESAYAALAACDADAIGYELTSELYISATEDPNICVAPVGDMGRYEIDINNNCTIPDYEGIESPTYGKKRAGFRKALAMLFDKDRVIDECCGGFANRNDQPIAYFTEAGETQTAGTKTAPTHTSTIQQQQLLCWMLKALHRALILTRSMILVCHTPLRT
jgi:ABC-type transport system substrate-binding protein